TRSGSAALNSAKVLPRRRAATSAGTSRGSMRKRMELPRNPLIGADCHQLVLVRAPPDSPDGRRWTHFPVWPVLRARARNAWIGGQRPSASILPFGCSRMQPKLRFPALLHLSKPRFCMASENSFLLPGRSPPLVAKADHDSNRSATGSHLYS